MSCFSGSSLRDENSSDISEDIVEELLSYVSRRKSIKEVKAKIENKCGIKKKGTWSVKDIKQAWRETKNMRTSSTRKKWSCVIVLEELKRRVLDDENSERKEAEPDLKENEGMHAFGTAQRKENTDSRSFVSNTDLKMVGNASQVAEQLQNTLIIEEQIEQNFCQHQQYIQIPLLDMSEEQQQDDIIESTNTTYKLINGYPLENEIRKRKSYVMSYNNATKNADWVYEILNKSTLANNCDPSPKFGDNYHKGHLASGANHRWCLEAFNDASLFSNMTPQQQTFNNSTWKSLEGDIRNIAHRKKVRNVHVYTGTLYLNRPEMKGVKALPSHLFKVIIVEEDNGIVEDPKCYLIPNKQPINLYTEYECNIQDIEDISNLKFICSSPGVKQDRIKTINWQGENVEGQISTANIKVRISS